MSQAYTTSKFVALLDSRVADLEAHGFLRKFSQFKDFTSSIAFKAPKLFRTSKLHSHFAQTPGPNKSFFLKSGFPNAGLDNLLSDGNKVPIVPKLDYFLETTETLVKDLRLERFSAISYKVLVLFTLSRISVRNMQ